MTTEPRCPPPLTEAPTCLGKGSTAWYLVHTKPRQETIALSNLERQGYVCYLPQMRVQRVRRQRASIVTEPMFARYLLIELDSSEQGKSWGPIRSTLGVHQLVHFGTQPAKVDPQLVALLREREQTLPTAALFQSGDAVVITQGPFAGIEAIYQNTDPEQRAFILLNILNKPVSLHIDPGQLRKAL